MIDALRYEIVRVLGFGEEVFEILASESPHFQPAFVVYAAARDGGAEPPLRTAVAAVLSRWAAMVIDDVLDAEPAKNGVRTLFGALDRRALAAGLALLTRCFELEPMFAAVWGPFVRGWVAERDLPWIRAALSKTSFPNVFTALIAARRAGVSDGLYLRNSLLFWRVVGLVQQLYDDLIDGDVPREILAESAREVEREVHNMRAPGPMHEHYWRSEIAWKWEAVKRELLR